MLQTLRSTNYLCFQLASINKSQIFSRRLTVASATIKRKPQEKPKPVIGLALGIVVYEDLLIVCDRKWKVFGSLFVFGLIFHSAKGWCHIGVIRALEHHKIFPQVIAGVSMGSVVGGAYAAGKLDVLEKFAKVSLMSIIISMEVHHVARSSNFGRFGSTQEKCFWIHQWRQSNRKVIRTRWSQRL
jgi:hypothetical protein